MGSFQLFQRPFGDISIHGGRKHRGTCISRPVQTGFQLSDRDIVIGGCLVKVEEQSWAGDNDAKLRISKVHIGKSLIPDSYIQRLAILLMEEAELAECIHAFLVGFGPLTLVKFVVNIVTLPEKGTIHSFNGVLNEVRICVRPVAMTELGVHFIYQVRNFICELDALPQSEGLCPTYQGGEIFDFCNANSFHLALLSNSNFLIRGRIAPETLQD